MADLYFCLPAQPVTYNQSAFFHGKLGGTHPRSPVLHGAGASGCKYWKAVTTIYGFRYLRVRFDLSETKSTNFRYTNDFPKLGLKTIIVVTLDLGGPKWYHWILRPWFPISHDCNRVRILNRFQDIAFDMSSIAIFDYISLSDTSSSDEFPWDDLRKI